MKVENIKEILIAGGGTAGWLSAAYLNKVFGDKIKITLIASEEINKIGVGEATIPTMRNTLNFLGFEEKDWMPKCNATYKSALKFINWKESPEVNPNDTFYHPFSHERELISKTFDSSFFPVVGEGFPSSYVWLKNREKLNNRQYVYETHYEPYLCDNNLSPRAINDKEQFTSYAYHFDASKLADYLKEKSIERGVEYIDDMIISVDRKENGFIKQLNTKGGRVLTADFFIDCTGFRSLLLNKTLNEPFVSDKESLFMNSAVAVHRDNDPDNEEISPYSNIRALKSGWSWDIPLFDRNGTGYVYCDEFIKKEEAEKELRSLMGEKCSNYTAKHLKLRVGKYKNVWQKNCLAIGLSGSFLEPLESTSIFFAEFQLALFVNLFPITECPEPVVKRYNSIFDEWFYEVRDFLVMHYVLTKREDTPFWRAVRNETKIPDSLKEKLELFKYQLPSMNGLKLNVFPPKSYVCILDGMGYLPEVTHFSGLMNADWKKLEQQQREFEKKRDQIVASQPTHYEYLKSMYLTKEVM